MYAPSSLLSRAVVSVQVGDPYVNTVSTAALKKFLFSFIGSVDFQTVSS